MRIPPGLLYRGFAEPHAATAPRLLCQSGLTVTPYLAVAEFYGQSGVVCAYYADFETDAQPHPGGLGPPFEVDVPDYEIRLSPDQVARLQFCASFWGQLLPGYCLTMPDGSTKRDRYPPRQFNHPIPYNTSHFC